MIIEVVGLPAAGKTETVQRLVPKLQDLGAAARWETLDPVDETKRGTLCQALIASPGLGLRLYASIPRSDRKRGQIWANACLRRTMIAKDLARSSDADPDGFAVLDSGIAFALTMTLSHSRSSAAQLAAFVPVPDHLVVLEVEPEESIRRLRTRMEARDVVNTRGKNPDILLAARVRVQRLLGEVADELASRGTQVHRIASDHLAPDEVVDGALRQIGAAVTVESDVSPERPA